MCAPSCTCTSSFLTKKCNDSKTIHDSKVDDIRDWISTSKRTIKDAKRKHHHRENSSIPLFMSNLDISRFTFIFPFIYIVAFTGSTRASERLDGGGLSDIDAWNFLRFDFFDISSILAALELRPRR